MMAKRQKQERISTEGGSSALEISLGSLLGRGETCGERRPEHSQGKEHREALSAAPSPRAQQAILSRESKGRGGKTVTAVSFRGSPPSDLNASQRNSALPSDAEEPWKESGFSFRETRRPGPKHGSPPGGRA